MWQRAEQDPNYKAEELGLDKIHSQECSINCHLRNPDMKPTQEKGRVDDQEKPGDIILKKNYKDGESSGHMQQREPRTVLNGELISRRKSVLNIANKNCTHCTWFSV